MSYACHVPILLNRTKVKEVLETFQIEATFRSVYGNYTQMGGELIEDVKIMDLNGLPGEDWSLVSTHEESFAKGKVGTYLRLYFPTPCKYELSFEDWIGQEKFESL